MSRGTSRIFPTIFPKRVMPPPRPPLQPLTEVRVDRQDAAWSFGLCHSCRRTRRVPTGITVCPVCVEEPR